MEGTYVTGIPIIKAEHSIKLITFLKFILSIWTVHIYLKRAYNSNKIDVHAEKITLSG